MRENDVCNFQVISLKIILLDVFSLLVGYEITKIVTTEKLLCVRW